MQSGEPSDRDHGAELRGLPWTKVDDLSAGQLAAMQTMDDARREGVLSEADAHVIEDLIRAGHVHGARKRVSSARRQAQSGSGG